MPEANDHLMEFQEFLMDVLYSNIDIELIQKKLATFSADPMITNWLQSITPSMLEVAARMTQHWGKKVS